MVVVNRFSRRNLHNINKDKYQHFSLTLYCFNAEGKVVAEGQRIFDLEVPVEERYLKEELDIFIRKLDAGNGDFTIPGNSKF